MKHYVICLLSLVIVWHGSWATESANEPSRVETQRFIEDLLDRDLLGVGGLYGGSMYWKRSSQTWEQRGSFLVTSASAASDGYITIEYTTIDSDDREKFLCEVRFHISDINLSWHARKLGGHSQIPIKCLGEKCIGDTCEVFRSSYGTQDFSRFKTKRKAKDSMFYLILRTERNAERLRNALSHLESLHGSYFDN